VSAPPEQDGSADLKFVLAVAESIGCNLTEYRVVVTKSTVPVGTADRVKQKIDDTPRARGVLVDVLTKYAANAMLATKISFMNELANPAERLGAEIEKVRLGIGADPRIGYHFIYPGCGYGGSCFPKDVRALARSATHQSFNAELLDAVEAVNRR